MPVPNPTDTNSYATKADIDALRRDLMDELKALRHDMAAEIKGVRLDIKDVQIDMFKWGVGVLAFFTALQTGIVTLLLRGFK